VFAAPYMQHALIAVVIVGVIAGWTGVHVVLRHLAFVADAMSHTVFPGVVIAFAAHQSLFLGALVAGAITAVGLTGLTSRPRIGEDASLAILLTTLFAVGVVVVSRQRRYSADLTTFLFGRLLAIGARDLWLMGAVAVVAIVVLVGGHKELVMRAFDPNGTEAMGYRVTRLDLVLNLLVAAVMVTALKAIGTTLAVAMLVTPAATARLVTRRVGTAVVTSIGVAVGAGIVGLVISYEASVRGGVRLTTSATIVSVLTLTFVVAAIASRIASRPAVAMSGGSDR